MLVPQLGPPKVNKVLTRVGEPGIPNIDEKDWNPRRTSWIINGFLQAGSRLSGENGQPCAKRIHVAGMSLLWARYAVAITVRAAEPGRAREKRLRR